jgi:hypothetical protein
MTPEESLRHVKMLIDGSEPMDSPFKSRPEDVVNKATRAGIGYNAKMVEAAGHYVYPKCQASIGGACREWADRGWDT